MLLRRLIGDALRRLRLEQGRSLRELARAAGVSLAYLSEVERGRKEPSSEVLRAICAALGITLLDLLHEIERDLAPRALAVDLTPREAPHELAPRASPHETLLAA